MAEVMMHLGVFGFSISTAAYDYLKRSTSWNWGSQSRFGRSPSRQYVGKSDDSITIDGTIYTERVGLAQIESMRQLADTGEPQLLVDQYGYIAGKWCIESVDETQSGFFADGAPRKQQFSMKLVAYGEDD